MRKTLYGLIALMMLMSVATTASAGISIGIGLPTLSIGINLPLYPELVPVPGYPVYYAPGVAGNYFFYDGMYWVYQDDNWYASSWYNGPWGLTDPYYVPLFVLRIPVSYYRQPPVYFSGWASNAPPRWGQHWGHSWEQRRGGWDHWNRGAAPSRAPLPTYQRQYAGDRYPRVEQQQNLRTQQYRYQPRDKAVRQHLQQVKQNAPAAQRGKQGRPQDGQQAAPNQGAPAAQRQQPQHREGQPAAQQRGPAAHEQRQQQPGQYQQQAPAQRQQPAQQHAPQQQPQHAPQQQQHAPQQQQHAPQQQQQHAPQDQQGGHEQRGGGLDRGGGQEQRGGGQEHGQGR
jgi:hypothetical protein